MAPKKKPIVENDLVLVYIQHQPAFFARIEKITPDVKKNWWQVTLLILQLPVQPTTWILDENQIREEDFTMGGIPVRLEKVVPPSLDEDTTSKIKDLKTATEKNKPELKASKTRQTQAAHTAPARILTMNSKKTDEKD